MVLVLVGSEVSNLKLASEKRNILMILTEMTQSGSARPAEVRGHVYILIIITTLLLLYNYYVSII